MNNEKILFETGATTRAVNELILYTDNTRELARMRDNIFDYFISILDKPIDMDFEALLKRAEAIYYKEMRREWWATDNERQEYCQIYANRFDEWKKEKEHNSK